MPSVNWTGWSSGLTPVFDNSPLSCDWYQEYESWARVYIRKQNIKYKLEWEEDVVKETETADDVEKGNYGVLLCLPAWEQDITFEWLFE